MLICVCERVCVEQTAMETHRSLESYLLFCIIVRPEIFTLKFTAHYVQGKKDGKCSYDLTVRHLLATILRVENQYK